nr:protein LYK5-like [Ipomoea batatas]GMD89062.1 protein LYK5-like [Ipomoea batatas]
MTTIIKNSETHSLTSSFSWRPNLFPQQRTKMNRILICTFVVLAVTPCTGAQQQYSGNSALDCKNTDANEPPSPAYLYTCNGQLFTCRAFLIFRATFPFNTVPAIAALLSSNASAIARLNNASKLTAFPGDKEVVVPVKCSCSGQYYAAKTSYEILSPDQTYFTIANTTYQGLSTCQSLEAENVYDEFSLKPGLELQIPLRCACPTKDQILNGTKYLLTYSIDWGDTIAGVAEKFNVSTGKIVAGNGVSAEDSTLFPFTTILVPLSGSPSIKSRNSETPISPQPESGVSRRRSKRGVYIGSGVAVGLSVVISVMVICVVYLFRRKKKEGNKAEPVEDILVEIAGIDRSLEVFRFKDLKKAAGDFGSRNRIKGSSVYRGVFKGRDDVVIKKMSTDASEEVNMLNKINHFNLVKLHGFSVHQGCYYLVFEYMKNGSLREWLKKKTPKEVTESWSLRIQIAIDVANGLHYLHSFTDPGYVHKNICSRNILLDCNFRAKIANFSFTKPVESPTTGRIAGTRGYLAQEYLDTASVTPKIDVYAFGVVLLELLTGKPAVFAREGREALLSAAIVSILRRENAETEIANFIEADLKQHGGVELAFQTAKLALRCLATDPADRPSMGEVVPSLLKIQASLQKSYQE